MALTLAVVVAGSVLAVKHGRWYLFPRRFAVVEAGLYRSGEMERGPYDRVVREYGIKTIVRLNNPLDPRLAAVEDAVVADHAIDRVDVFLRYGSGTAPFDELEKAAAVVADESRRPMLFHCAAGSRRSSAVQAVYRLKHCRWTWARTAAELDEFGINPEATPELYAHLERYARERPVASAARAP